MKDKKKLYSNSLGWGGGGDVIIAACFVYPKSILHNYTYWSLMVSFSPKLRGGGQ